MNQNIDHTRFEPVKKWRPSKVVIILPGLGAGGSEHVVSMVANHWARRGMEVTILTLEPPRSMPYYHFGPEIRTIQIGVPPRPASRLTATWLVLQRIRRMRRAIRQVKPDFVLSFLTRTNVLALVSTQGSGIPVIVSERNNPEAQPFGRGWKLLQRAFYPRAFGLVAMTSGAMNYYPKRMRRRSWIIPNAVDLPVDWKSTRRGCVVAAVGRLTHQKGFDILLDAFAKVEGAFPDWRLVIWGEGEDRPKLEEKRRALGLDERVDMPGVTAKPGKWVESTDVFVLSSRYEGWGIVLLEAMAAGLPVISFNCKWGPAEMIRHDENGLLIPAGDAEALAEGLTRLMSDDTLRDRLSAKAVQTSKLYSQDAVLAQWDEVALSALAAKSAK